MDNVAEYVAIKKKIELLSKLKGGAPAQLLAALDALWEQMNPLEHLSADTERAKAQHDPE